MNNCFFFCTAEDLKQKLAAFLANLHCFFPLINSAEPLQFTVTLIPLPSAVPMKPIIAHLFFLSTVSLKIIFVRQLAKSERIRDFMRMINSFLVVFAKGRWQRRLKSDIILDGFPFSFKLQSHCH